MKKQICLITTLCTALSAFSMNTPNPNAPLLQAIDQEDIAAATALIEQGANTGRAFSYAASTGKQTMVEFLIRMNADVPYFYPPSGSAPWTYNSGLMWAAKRNDIHMVDTILTQVSIADAKFIFTGLLVINRMKVVNNPWVVEQVDVVAIKPDLLLQKPRQLITKKIIDQFIQERMHRAKCLNDPNYFKGCGYPYTASTLAKRHNHQTIVDLLDFKNPQSYERLRKMIESGIKHTLFGKSKNPE